jgi:hypothetical protein
MGSHRTPGNPRWSGAVIRGRKLVAGSRGELDTPTGKMKGIVMARKTRTELRQRRRAAAHKNRMRGSRVLGLGLVISMLFTGIALASDLDVATLDVDTNAPVTGVTLEPGDDYTFKIKMEISGRQDHPASFKINKDWTLAGGTFTGSNTETIEVPPRAAGGAATVIERTGKVTVAAGQADGEFPLEIRGYDIVTSAPGALGMRTAATLNVTVEAQAVGDETPPEITITTPADGAVYTLNQVVLADYSCTDGESDVTKCEGPVADGAAIDTASVGTKSFRVDAESAGGESSLTHSYRVEYDFIGFDRPINNDALNRAKAGQAIPLKWQLLDAAGEPVTDLASVKVSVANLSCNLGTTSDEVEEYAAGSSGLQNLGDGYYQFNWKTPTSYANSCKTMSLNLGEGAPRTATFQFTR